MEGTLHVGFITSNQLNNTLFTKVLTKGDVFVQNLGLRTIANSVFGSKPPINVFVLTKAFQVDNKLINSLQAQNWFDNH
ncbi:hypothetical protein EUGRSUZ_G01865 [Eucalyptus grandis]|uniref:Uncharacterized protein n=2 Tax=Eucalyptus grandis TaxID=71139 RepID=A0ACC3K5G9_EUCGR|nr:hypothetical protein EUGRSUZ_G01865 [Eucalyptus grandis]